MRLSCRWTRKKPTAGASTPTIAPAAKARRMNSESNMDVRGVVPDAGQLTRRVVEDEQRRLRRERLGDKCPLLLPAGQPGERAVGHGSEADTGDRLFDCTPVRSTQRAEQTAADEAARGYDLAHGRGRVSAELRALGEVAQLGAVRKAVR